MPVNEVFAGIEGKIDPHEAKFVKQPEFPAISKR
jgi:hypothetical protein